MFKTVYLFMLKLVLLLSAQIQTVVDQSQINELFSQWSDNEKPGIAVAVTKNDKTVYEKYHGVANMEHKSLINAESKFLIASVSKQFTAFAIALLEDEQKLDFNDAVQKHIPEFPKYNHDITIMHLLNHTSGLRDIDDLNGLIGVGLSDYVSFNDAYKLIIQQKGLNFEPGTKYDYSNSGYILLAKIVENISGKSFRDFMDERVFDPLNMKDTLVFDNPFEVIGNKTTSYYSNDGNNFSKSSSLSSVYGSTGMYTTLRDLNRWSKNFNQPKVGNIKIFKKMEAQGLLNNGEKISYAMGQEIKTHNGYKAIFHGGGVGAYRAYLLRFPSEKLSVAILSNSSYSTSFILDYAYNIADMYLGKTNDVAQEKEIKAASIQPVIIDRNKLKQFVGEYQIQPGLIFTIKENEVGIELFITGNETGIPLKPQSDREFVLMDSNNGYHLRFNEGGEKKVQSLSYYQYDMEYIGKRVNLIEFDKENINWLELEGEYYSKELNTIYSLRFNGEKLMAHHARNLPIDLSPHQPNVFYSQSTFFQEIEFLRNKDQKVNGILVSGSRSKNINFVKMVEIDLRKAMN